MFALDQRHRYVLAAIASFGGALFGQSSNITGTAFYRERIALTRDAVLEATLEDTSVAGKTVASTRIESPGQPPFAISIPFEPARIDKTHNYAVRVAILTRDGSILFSSDKAYPVLKNGRTDAGRMLLVRARSSAVDGVAPLPASYSGNLPCADCSGIRHTLNLLAGNSYISRMEYLGKTGAKPFERTGRWKITAGGKTLVPTAGAESERFAIRDGALRQLDREGKEIQSPFNIDLRRDPTFVALPTGAPLHDREWTIRQIDGQAVVRSGQDAREPSIQFHSEGNRVTGYSGCNQMSGSFDLKGTKLQFQPIAATKRACLAGMETETRLFKALPRVRSWRIAGQRLELLDESGAIAVLLEPAVR